MQQKYAFDIEKIFPIINPAALLNDEPSLVMGITDSLVRSTRSAPGKIESEPRNKLKLKKGYNVMRVKP